ncbi:PREDICTED: intraflagellar transport protein 20 homolog [Nicrophorus vespilloides]|uniref:Intraflagellar transport protein 20 homolog n=1 Tax=Nicrophorus vespilloides TaxID=110193 RepID=A0ABM1M482_NICVS|nr:PREDICTED: intraflagellar transport protein 20 homolog [Nicrophorus vespilloides]
MSEILSTIGVYFDEVDKVRILEPDVSNQTNVLKDECKIYVEKIDEFQKLIDNFINIMDKLGKEVERQKMKAISTRNIMQTMEKRREVDQQQLQALIMEKSMEVERLKVQLNSLQKQELEQLDIITTLTNN